LKENDSAPVTSLLAKWQEGNPAALDALMPLVYDELYRRARSYMRSEKAGHTLQPTALLHEAYLRLVDHEQSTWKDRAHFFAVTSQIIRHILVDHARSRGRLKRGGPAVRIAMAEGLAVTEPQEIDLVDLDGALERLTALDQRQGRIVELRFFGGLSIEETSEALKISPATVKREWSIARAWLYRELTKEPPRAKV
jgi:RNA polymerase sigma factor (TIGR02999 family)